MANWWTYKDKKKAEANNGTSRQPERHQADAKPAVNNENWWKYRPENSTFYQMQASDRDQLEQQAQMRQYLETVLPYYERYHAARNAVLENRKWDAFSDKIERAIPFMSGDSLAAQERAANIAASRYDRDFLLFQQMMENAVSGRPYNKAYDMAANAHSTVSQKYNAYNNARLQNLHDTDRGAYYAETMDRSEIEAELARLKAGGSTTHISASGAMHGGAGGKIDEPVTQSGDRIAQYERALSILQDRDNTKKYEEIKAAWWSPDNQPELDLTESGAEDLYYSPLKREATELAELGRAAYEKDLANGAHYASSGALHGGYGGKLYSGDEEERNRQLGIDAEAAIEAQVKESALFGPDATHTPAKTYSERGPEEGYLQQWQKDIFYAMYATDPEEAKRWLTLAHEQAENEYLQGVSDETGRNFVTQILGIPLAAGAGLLSGLDPFGETGQALSKFSEAVTHGGAKAWNEASGTANIPLLGEKGLGDLYSLGVSMVQSGALAVGSAAAGRYDATLATVVEFLGTTLLGSSVAASDYRQSLNRGLNREQAMRHATAAGIAEAAFEYISLDKLVNQDVSRGFWKNVFMQGGIEASEELCTTLANRASDALLAYAEGYDTSIQQRVKELVALGLSRRDAEYKAEQEWFAELISDGLGGFVSGGLMTAGNTVVNWNEYQSGREQQRTAGEYARNARQTDALRRYAEDNGLGWYAKEQATRTETAQVKDTTSTTSQGEAPYSQGKGSGGQVARATQENDGTGNLSPTTKQTKKSRGEKHQERQQAREQRKQDRQIGSDALRVQTHIQEQIAGKTVQEQQAVRDQLRERYGDGILSSVYKAVSQEAARHAENLKGGDAILEARNKAMSQTEDTAMKDAIARGYDNVGFTRAAASGNTQAAGRYMQQARNNKAEALRLEASVTGEGGQSATVSIQDMTKDGKKAVLSDGRTVSPDQLTEMGFDAETADVVGMISRFGMGKDAGAVLQAIAKNAHNSDGYRFALEYATAWDQGRQGILSAPEAAKRSSLDPDTVWEAYEAGKKARMESEERAEAAKQEAVKKATEARDGVTDSLTSLRSAQNDKNGKQTAKREGATGRKGSVTISEAVDRGSFSKQQMQDLEVVTKLAEFCGVDVVLEGSEIDTDEKGRAVYVGAHGWYVDGVIHLDVNAGKSFVADAVGSLLATTGHELTHFMQQYAPKQYAQYKAAILQAIVKIDGERTLERLIAEEQKNSTRDGGLDKIAAEDEVVADASQKRMGDRVFWETVIEAAGQENRSGIKRAFDWLKGWFGKIREAITGFDKYTDAARILDKAESSVQEALGQLFAEGMAEAVRTHDLVGDIKNTAQEGGGVQYMLRGVNKDGIEVYETSDAVMKMSEVDRKQRYLAMMKNQYLGRAARFTRNGHIFYAIFDPSDHRKPIYGDKRNSRAGYKAMLRAAAEGDFFDLVENSDYSRSSKNRKNHTNADYFDYFIKTVQIDNKVYDLIADVERFYFDGDGGYVYTLALTDNKTIKASPATHPAQGGTVNTAGSTLTNTSIAQTAPNGNTQNQNNTSDPHMERSYEQGSDLELMAQAAESLSEAGGEEYWAALLESAPELAEDQGQLRGLMKDYRAQAKRLAEAEAKLAEARRQLTTTNRKLNTRGLAGAVQTMMKQMDAGDAKGRGVAKQVTQTLTEAYQKALDALDEGADAGQAWEIVYAEGVEKAAEILAKDATHSEKYGRRWATDSLTSYYGEGAQEAILAEVSAAVAEDFMNNRYRPGIRETAADRITERVEKRMQKQVDAATERAATAEQANDKLRRDLDFWKNAQEKASDQASFLDERLREARAELRDSQRATAQEKKTKADRIRSMDAQIKAKRQEAQAWKKLAERNESLLRAALKSKNADLNALQVQMDRNATEAQKKQAALVRQLEQQAQRERDILTGKLKPPAMQRLLKVEREQAAAKMAAHKDEVFAAQKERKKATALRGRIGNLKAELQKRLANPSDRSYVPAGLATALVDALDAIDNSPRAGTQAAAKYASVSESLRALASAYDDISTDEDVGYEFRSEFDPELRDQIKELAKTMQGRNLRELSAAELEQVYDAVKSIRDSMRNAAKLLNSEQWASVYDAIESVVNQQQSMTPIADVSKTEARKRRRLLDNLSPMRAVEMMANWDRNAALYQIFQAVEQGGVEEMGWIMGYNKGLQTMKTGKNEKAYREAMTKLHDYGATEKTTGKTVKMTQMQAIQLYMTWQREQANDKLVHLQKGGATIRDALAVMDGKRGKATSHTVEVTPELISNIEQSLSAWDRAYMEEIRRYLTKEARETNKVLYQLKHRVLTTEAAYVPYVVDKGYLESKLEGSDVFNLFVKTPGSTQALQKRAPQPVIIDGMDTLMGRHVQEQARYIGLAVPIRDFAKVFNGRLADPNGGVYTALKKTIEDNFGEGGTHLILQALLDAQGGGMANSWSSHIEEHLNKLQGAFVRSALLINPSVTIKQAASYSAAESVLSHRALMAGNRTFAAKGDQSHSPGLIAQLFASPEGRTARRLYEEIDAHTSMHYQRRMGMSYTELANEAQRSGKIRRTLNSVGAQMEQSPLGHNVRKAGEILNPAQWIQRMDVATTAALWVAAKEQARMDGMAVGSAEYWQHTTELYERCLRETQPMYDGLHRNSHQKQGGSLMQYLFPFRTVPIQNHGQIAAAFETLRASKGKSEAKQAEARRFFAKTVWAQTESAAVFAFMTFLAAVMKRKTKKYRDDETEELTAGSLLKGLGLDAASTLFSVAFPMWGSEAWSIGDRALNKLTGKGGYTFDAFSVGAVDLLNDLASSGDKLLTDAGKLMRGEDLTLREVGDHALAALLKAAKIAGIPADTVRTYVEGTIGNIKDITEGRVPALNDETWERKAGVNAVRYLRAWDVDDSAKMEEIIREIRQSYLKDGKTSEKADELTRNALSDAAVDVYKAGGMDLDELADILGGTGLWDQENLSNKIKGLLRDEYKDGSRSEEDAIEALERFVGWDHNKAWKKVREWTATAEHGDEEDYNYSEYEELRDALDDGESLEDAGTDYLAHGYTEKQIRDAAVKHLRQKYLDGDVSEEEAAELLKDYQRRKEQGEYREITDDEAYFTIREWEANEAHEDDEEYNYSKYEAVRQAIGANGDLRPVIRELTAHGVSEKQIRSEAKSYLVEKYEAGAWSEAAFKNYLSRYCQITGKDADEITNDANCFKETGHRLDDLDGDYLEGGLTAEKAEQILICFGGKSSEEARKRLRWLDLKKKEPGLEISEKAANRYYDGTDKLLQTGHRTASQTGMTAKQYADAMEILRQVTGVDRDGDGRSDDTTKEQAYIAAIAAMNLTPAQKDALYFAEYKGANRRKGVYKTW